MDLEHQRVRRVLYRPPEVREAIAADRVICIAEGEEDVEALRRHGYTATCNDSGAKKWTNALAEQMRGTSQVVIFGDNAGGETTLEQRLRAIHALSQASEVYANLLKTSDLEARLAALEQALLQRRHGYRA
jgi:hypothetical protein